MLPWFRGMIATFFMGSNVRPVSIGLHWYACYMMARMWPSHLGSVKVWLCPLKSGHHDRENTTPVGIKFQARFCRLSAESGYLDSVKYSSQLIPQYNLNHLVVHHMTRDTVLAQNLTWNIWRRKLRDSQAGLVLWNATGLLKNTINWNLETFLPLNPKILWLNQPCNFWSAEKCF